MHKAVRSSIFECSDQGHGGNRRTLQLESILRSHGIALADIKPFQYNSESILGFREFCSSFFYQYKTRRILKRLAGRSNASFCLWENTDHSNMASCLLNIMPFVAAPHNIESFVLRRYSFDLPQGSLRHISRSLGKELEAFRRASSVFTISYEDSWLLSNMGISSYLLPYHPSSDLRDQLLGIRRQRVNFSSRDKPLALLMGTVGNPCTMDGITTFLSTAKKLCLHEYFRIIVAGYGTERLRPHLSDDFEILGTLEPHRLTELLSSIDFAVVHQSYGSGSLTKIPELLFCGIPILASRHAARSFTGVDGVYVFHHDEQILSCVEELMNDKLSGMPPLPPSIAEYEARFASECLSLCA